MHLEGRETVRWESAVLETSYDIEIQSSLGGACLGGGQRFWGLVLVFESWDRKDLALVTGGTSDRTLTLLVGSRWTFHLGHRLLPWDLGRLLYITGRDLTVWTRAEGSVLVAYRRLDWRWTY